MCAISSPQILHAIIEGCFTQKNRTLWRLDSLHNNLYLLLVSEIIPDFEKLASQLCLDGECGQTKDYTAFLSSIKNGQKLRFRLRGNTVYSKSGDGGDLDHHDRSLDVRKANRGKVVPHVSEHHKRMWLVKKAERYGFFLEDHTFSLIEMGQHRFYKKSASKSLPIQISHATFEGTLTVADANLFKRALTMGIGKAKAYGCGLMTVMVI